MKITDGGVCHNARGANHNARLLWYALGGVNPNDKTVMINPQGGTTMGGLMKTLHRPQRSCGQGNIFAPVCDSVQRGGVCLSACWDTPPGSRHPPWEQTFPRGQTPPLGANTSPGKQTPAYSQ